MGALSRIRSATSNSSVDTTELGDAQAAHRAADAILIDYIDNVDFCTSQVELWEEYAGLMSHIDSLDFWTAQSLPASSAVSQAAPIAEKRAEPVADPIDSSKQLTVEMPVVAQAPATVVQSRASISAFAQATAQEQVIFGKAANAGVIDYIDFGTSQIERWAEDADLMSHIDALDFWTAQPLPASSPASQAAPTPEKRPEPVADPVDSSKQLTVEMADVAQAPATFAQSRASMSNFAQATAQEQLLLFGRAANAVVIDYIDNIDFGTSQIERWAEDADLMNHIDALDFWTAQPLPASSAGPQAAPIADKRPEPVADPVDNSKQLTVEIADVAQAPATFAPSRASMSDFAQATAQEQVLFRSCSTAIIIGTYMRCQCHGQIVCVCVCATVLCSVQLHCARRVLVKTQAYLCGLQPLQLLLWLVLETALSGAII